MQTPSSDALRAALRTVPDFPKPGIQFIDITPILQDPTLFGLCIDLFCDRYKDLRLDAVVAIEARGFIFAAPVALKLGAGFVPVRKPGKLPGKVDEQSFALEYGNETLTIHSDALWRGARVMVIDDVLATGGTIGATAELIKRQGAELVHVAVLMELGFLGGRERLAQSGVDTLSAVVTV